MSRRNTLAAKARRRAGRAARGQEIYRSCGHRRFDARQYPDCSVCTEAIADTERLVAEVLDERN